jgi:hypothetical protein
MTHTCVKTQGVQPFHQLEAKGLQPHQPQPVGAAALLLGLDFLLEKGGFVEQRRELKGHGSSVEILEVRPTTTKRHRAYPMRSDMTIKGIARGARPRIHINEIIEGPRVSRRRLPISPHACVMFRERRAGAISAGATLDRDAIQIR